MENYHVLGIIKHKRSITFLYFEKWFSEISSSCYWGSFFMHATFWPFPHRKMSWRVAMERKMQWSMCRKICAFSSTLYIVVCKAMRRLAARRLIVSHPKHNINYKVNENCKFVRFRDALKCCSSVKGLNFWLKATEIGFSYSQTPLQIDTARTIIFQSRVWELVISNSM